MSRESHETVFNSRRSILKAAGGCALMTNTSLMSTLLSLQASKATMAADPDPQGYKAIVCLFFFGGIDSYNMLAPADGTTTTGEYGDYHESRNGYDDGTNNPGGLALQQSDLLAIAGPDGRGFGMHPGFSEEVNPVDPDNTGVQRLYNEGKLSFIANIGSLVERTTRASYNARVGRPLGLFSHADLQRHWQTGAPETRSRVNGWGGRMADLLKDTNTNTSVSMNISVSGVNLFQTGQDVVPYTIGTGGATTISGYSPGYTTSNRQNRMFSRAMDNILDQTYTDLLAKSFADTTRNSTDAAIAFNQAVNSVELATEFEDDSPSTQLEMVARCIGSRETLGQTRQVFFVGFGGWDMHSNLILGQEARMPRVSRALTSFSKAMGELGVDSDVTLFTASDFARTLGSNGQGSDHGWGGNQIMMGGGVNGGQIVGDYPLLNAANDLNVGRGRMIPTTAVDELAAELAMWFGIDNDSSMETVIPNIRRFLAENDPAPLGLLS